MDKSEILQKISSYKYYRARLEEVQEQIDAMCYKTTATYGNLAPSTGGGFNSKVEKYGNREYELQKKKQSLQARIQEIESLIECSGLDEREKGVMLWIAECGKLQAYARRQHIGKDNVYKIRDRAVNKIIVAHTPQNVI